MAKKKETIASRLTEMRKSTPASVESATEDLSRKAAATNAPAMPVAKPSGGVSFKEAFRAARKDNPGKPFTWNGKSYSTQMKGEGAAKPATRSGTAPTRTAPRPVSSRPTPSAAKPATIEAPRSLRAPEYRDPRGALPGGAARRFRQDNTPFKVSAPDKPKSRGTTFYEESEKGRKLYTPKQFKRGGPVTGPSTTKPMTSDAAKQRKAFEDQMTKQNKAGQDAGKREGKKAPGYAGGGMVSRGNGIAKRGFGKACGGTVKKG